MPFVSVVFAWSYVSRLPCGAWKRSVCSGAMTDQGNNNQNISCNPFAALFSSVADAKQFASGQKQQEHLGPPCKSRGRQRACL